MTEHGATGCTVVHPSSTRHISTGSERAIRVRTCKDVVMVVAHRVGSLGEGISCRESVVLAVEIGETGRDPYALSIEPRAVSDSIARMYRTLPSCWRRTKI